jgi:hypothetical protein
MVRVVCLTPALQPRRPLRRILPQKPAAVGCKRWLGRTRFGIGIQRVANEGHPQKETEEPESLA